MRRTGHQPIRARSYWWWTEPWLSLAPPLVDTSEPLTRPEHVSRWGQCGADMAAYRKSENPERLLPGAHWSLWLTNRTDQRTGHFDRAQPLAVGAGAQQHRLLVLLCSNADMA
jgi:hypothetical protein